MTWPGIYRGKVTNNQDPQGKFRIKAIVPQVFGTTVETEWAEPALPPGWNTSPSALLQAHPDLVLTGADPQGGTVSVDKPAQNHVLSMPVPHVGDGVWLMFEGGDSDHPVWIGVWY